MLQNWTSRFSDNTRDYGGYSIGKLFKLLNDPEIISLAGGLPSPDTFLKDDLQRISQIKLQEDADTIIALGGVLRSSRCRYTGSGLPGERRAASGSAYR